jgi:hypothetical protein
LYFRQPPAPSQVPFVPHDATPWSLHTPRGSAAPPATGAQRPIEDGSAQLLQVPSHASAQQTPSTQKPLAHSVAAAQVCPGGFGPQLPATHACPGWQSSSTVHFVTQALLLHRYGKQFCTPGARHAPRPLHVPAVSRRSPAHAGGVQIVSAA